MAATTAEPSQPTSTSARHTYVTDKYTNMTFLVDTGAAVSILNRKCDFVKANISALYSVTGSNVTIFGHNTMTLKFGMGPDYTFTFVVADVSFNILGNDFLKHFDLSVRPNRNQLIDNSSGIIFNGVTSNTFNFVSPLYNINTDNDEVARLIKDNVSLFTPFSDKLTPNCKTRQSIDTISEQPVTCRHVRNLSAKQLAIAKREFDRMLGEGIIRRSNSTWASPLVLVPKKVEGDWRPCGDYRRVNSITRKDQYPLPNVQSILSACAGKRYFSSLDAQRAFYQIPLEEAAIPKTAVKTPFGLFEFLRMPYGLKNSAQTFQRYMDEVLHGIDNVHCYVDDIIIATDTPEEHIQTLQKVFVRLQEYGIRLNESKCEWYRTSLEYLGHKISHDSIQPTNKKIEAIKQFKEPTTVRELKSFLGMIEYYRRFFPSLADLIEPLNRHRKPESKRVRNSKPIELTDDDKAIIQKVKDTFSEGMRLHSHDYSAALQLYTDASDFAIGASLEQCKDGTSCPIAFFSRKLSKTEQNYDTFGKELLAVYAAVKHFWLYLTPGNFTVYTDHQALVSAVKNCPDNVPRRVNTQLQKLSEYEFNMVHLKGDKNLVADYLSRLVSVVATEPTVMPAELSVEQTKDNDIKDLVQKYPDQFYAVEIDSMKIWCHGTTNKTSKVVPVVPNSLRRRIFDQLHSSNHFGFKRTFDLIRNRYFWPRMGRDVKQWCSACHNCKIAKITRHTKVQQDPVEIPTVRFQEVHMDFVDLPECDGYNGLLTITDRYTRWLEAIPVKDASTKTVINNFLLNWMARYGVPFRVITDRGPQFMSRDFSDFCKFIGMKHSPTTAYNPRSNGIDERQHRIIKDSLRAMPNDRWMDHLPMLLLSIRGAIKEPINTSSAYLTFAQDLRFPGELITESSNAFRNFSHSELITRLNDIFGRMQPVKSRRARKPYYIPKDLREANHVYVLAGARTNCLSPMYEGPFKVVNRQEKYFTIERKGKHDTVAIDRLIPAMVSCEDEKPTLHQTHDTESTKRVLRPPPHVKFDPKPGFIHY